MPPRATFAYLFFPLLVILKELGYVRILKEEIIEAINVLKDLQKRYRKDRTKEENPLKGIVERLQDKTPLILTSVGLSSCGWRLKNQFNENSKVLAFCNFFPELNHNEIEGWNYELPTSKNIFVLLLRDKYEHPRIKKRIEITTRIIKDKVEGISEINSQGKGLLARILSLLYIGDWASVYLASLRDIDPIPTPKIDFLKREMALETAVLTSLQVLTARSLFIK
jgi:glucose/mannose-6-phosphate isomerase